MVLFQVVTVQVNGTGGYSGTVDFDQPISTAEVTLRGMALPGYVDGSPYHYRGPTQVWIENVVVSNTEVHFDFSFNYSESGDYQMEGLLNFLVIANADLK